MTRFTPELGQFSFSNTEWQECELSELATAALGAIGDKIERVMGNRTQTPYDAPIHNVGGCEFKTPAFVMRPYCWCDGADHPNGCPPNFEWQDVKICWYKHYKRGASCNIDLTPDRVAEMLTECLASVRTADMEP